MFRRDALAGGELVRYRMARTLAGRPLYVASCYRVGPLLVDAGTPNRVHELRRALEGERVASILVTHGHEDHAGNLGAFREARAYGAEGLRISRNIPFYRRSAWGEPRPGGEVHPVGDGLEAAGLEFRPLPTPGHTQDHLAYVVRDRGWLFAGDAALGMLKYGFVEEDIHAYMASLRRMLDARPAVVFPSHGPVLDRPQEQLGAQLAHLERLRDEARRLAREGLQEGEITRRLLGVEGPFGLFSGGEFSKRRLVQGLLRGGKAA